MKAVGLITTAVAVFILGMFLKGLALSLMWGWFFVPALGVPPVSIAAATGIYLTVSALTYHGTGEQNKQTYEFLIELAVKSIIGPLTLILFGYIVQFFM